MPLDDAGTAREILSRLLAACYYEPGAEFVEERVFATMATAAARLDPQLASVAEKLDAAFNSVPLDDLLLDHTRLFLGPNELLAAPYGSVWLSGEKALMQDTTMAVLELYREGGFDLDDAFRELPDHVAAELEFLYLLIFRENRARQAGDAAALGSAVALRRRFLGEHLGVWIDKFAAAMSAGAATEFYRLLPELTARFIDMETARTA